MRHGAEFFSNNGTDAAFFYASMPFVAKIISQFNLKIIRTSKPKQLCNQTHELKQSHHQKEVDLEERLISIFSFPYRKFRKDVGCFLCVKIFIPGIFSPARFKSE